ncbi:peroxisomal NADH pyrophosphatase NUDT12 isoform X2 [Electrophorus electricus]|uniref:peroxisomal NADH pyrophosphatase NUDT12 isoform X2 n=1 Tax=Electrophorus electricus TaxID=8005 RepID=UPI0015CF9A2A|nr:peroxisomal NADH pyrophosphatase NUDT12 isoform X2 [Electrophorus electricus]
MTSVQMSATDEMVEGFLDHASRGDLVRVSDMICYSSKLLNESGKQGWTALMLAARNGHFDLVKALLSKGCNKDLKNKSGQTAHDIAKFWGHKHIADLLVGDGKIRDILPSTGVTEHENYFSREYLSRMSDKRTDSGWLSAKQSSPETVFLLFHNLDPLVTSGPEHMNNSQAKLKLCRLKRDSVGVLLKKSDIVVVFLGVEKQECSSLSSVSKEEDGLIAWFALNVEENPSEILKIEDSHSFFLQGPMPTLLMLNEDEGDPVVIMLVIHPDGNQCLLGRKKTFPPGMFSCLAGFIEPGETIENAVRREVMEESGVTVGPVRYVSCQPWPMPSSLMIGCISVAVSTDIKVDKDEIEEARWFTRQQVIDAIVKSSKAVLTMPPRQAIAHYLVKHWTCLNSNL